MVYLTALNSTELWKCNGSQWTLLPAIFLEIKYWCNWISHPHWSVNVQMGISLSKNVKNWRNGDNHWIKISISDTWVCSIKLPWEPWKFLNGVSEVLRLLCPDRGYKRKQNLQPDIEKQRERAFRTPHGPHSLPEPSRTGCFCQLNEGEKMPQNPFLNII